MKFMSSEEVQDQLGISRPTLYLWVRQGKLLPQRAGRALRFDETQVLRLLGRGPQVPAWIRGGRVEEAKLEVRRWVRSNVRPTILLEYLSDPGPSFARAKVRSSGEGSALPTPAPGGVLFDSLLESLKRRDWVFLSHEESLWVLHDVQAETGPGGDPYIAVELVRPQGPGEGDGRDQRLHEFAETLRRGLYRGPVKPWSRGELYERGPG